MDKVIVFGVFEFIGFHICEEMLENGYETLGVRSVRDDLQTVEEMRLQVGRNANFHEIDEREWYFSKLNDPAIIVANYYDYYIKNKENDFFREKVGGNLVNHLERIKNFNSKFIFLLPIQCLSEKREKDEFLTELLSLLKSEEIPVIKLYLPTIYGPWQPQDFIFQKTLLTEPDKRNKLEINKREWTEDAIYVKDLVRTLLEKVEKNDLIDEYILKSDVENHWERCAELLGIKLSKESHSQSLKNNKIPELIIKTEMSTESGLEEQKRIVKFRSQFFE